MSGESFDALARLVWTRKSRRTALGARVGEALLGQARGPNTGPRGTGAFAVNRGAIRGRFGRW